MLALLLLMVGAVYYSLPKRHVAIIRYIGFLTLFSYIYLFGYFMEVNVTTLDSKIFWNYVQYLTIPFIPGLWLLVALRYVKNKPLEKNIIIVIFIVPVISFINRYTNSMHNLFYTDYILEDTVIGPMMRLEYGILYYIQVTYISLVFLVASMLFFKELLKDKNPYRSQIMKMFIASLGPAIGVFLNLLLTSIMPLDYSALFFPIAIILWLLTLHKEHKLAITPFARNHIFHTSNQAVIIFDIRMNIVDFNQKALSMFPHLKSFKYHSFQDFKQEEPLFPTMSKAQKHEYFQKLDQTYQLSVDRFTDQTNAHIGYMYSFTDVTENMKIINKLKENEEKITYLIYHDSLTQLYNRNYLEKTLERYNKAPKEVYLVYIDMNQLKAVNDQFGHQEGDQTLITLTQYIKASFLPSDLIFRMGGDEFLILSELSSQEELKDAITELQEKVKEKPHLSFAVGYSKMTDKDQFSQKLKEAEDKMYYHKRSQKNI